MQISISTRHGQTSAETRERITEKLEKLPRLYDRLTAAQVTLDLEREENRKVEVRLSVEHTEDLVATAESGDLLGLIDQAIHKLEKQLRKHKEKFITRRGATRKQQEVTMRTRAEEDEE